MSAHTKNKPDALGEAWNTPNLMSATTGLDLLESQLAFWRHNFDISRRLLRHQQDQMLRLWRTQLEQVGGALPDGQAAGPTNMFTPMLAVFKAAEQMSGAALDAQRSAIDAMTPH